QFAFTGRCRKISRVLNSEVYVSKAFTTDKKIISLGKYCKKYYAIWDTGATGSVITSKVVEDCELQPTGRCRMHTASTIEDVNVYLVNFWLPNRMMIPNVRVTEGRIAGEVEILIGMDIINKGDFTISNLNGKTVFSFRMPSLECVDYVEEIKKLQSAKANKIGRNDPCPCGSGKKYKKCCGK
ncbi:unnamed protein product, partial [marine sediment metagenome]